MIENIIITVKKIRNAVTNSPTKRLADMTATEHITKSTMTVISNNASCNSDSYRKLFTRRNF